jgi:hypothetical protein
VRCLGTGGADDKRGSAGVWRYSGRLGLCFPEDGNVIFLRMMPILGFCSLPMSSITLLFRLSSSNLAQEDLRFSTDHKAESRTYPLSGTCSQPVIHPPFPPKKDMKCSGESPSGKLRHYGTIKCLHLQDSGFNRRLLPFLPSGSSGTPEGEQVPIAGCAA